MTKISLARMQVVYTISHNEPTALQCFVLPGLRLHVDAAEFRRSSYQEYVVEEGSQGVVSMSFSRNTKALVAVMTLGMLNGADRFNGMANPALQPEPDMVQFAGCVHKIGEAYVVRDDVSGRVFEIRGRNNGAKNVGRYAIPGRYEEKHVSTHHALVMHDEHCLFDTSALVVIVDKFDAVTKGCSVTRAGASASHGPALKTLAVRWQAALLLLQLVLLPLVARSNRGL